jgi:predicted PurR-regulated permease PerM
MLSNGILGLFLGPVVLGVGYKLFAMWLQESPVPAELSVGDAASKD